MSPDVGTDWLPPWLSRLGAAVWVSDDRGRLRWGNARAETLLGCRLKARELQPCHGVVRAMEVDGGVYCRPACTPMCLARDGEEIGPCTLRLPGPVGGEDSALVFFIPLVPPDGSDPWLVHVAIDANPTHRLEDYLRTVASRSYEHAPTASFPRCAGLTPREEEVLEHLSHDEDLQHVADALFVSHATVRNHVQHVLAKLGVHSIEEAVAVHLLTHVRPIRPVRTRPSSHAAPSRDKAR